MIVVMRSSTPAGEIERVSKELHRWNITLEKSVVHHKLVISLVGDTAAIEPQQIKK